MKRNNYLSVTFRSYGHWKVETTYYGRKIAYITTNSKAVDDYKDDDSRTRNRGYDTLRRECIREYKGF